jgi:thioredoxin 1
LKKGLFLGKIKGREKMLELTDKSFEDEVLRVKEAILVDFWAPWCGPCQLAGPVIEELAKEYEGQVKVGKINVDENPKTAEKYGVMSIPTVIIFKDGKEVKRQVGFPGKAGYESLIREVA